MSKLSVENKFIDVSDYGRPIARIWANYLSDTNVTPVQVTLVFGLCGMAAIYFILIGYYWVAAFFLILKSIIDAVDGELARIKETPSYTGRYLDSIFDSILNFFFLIAIWFVAGASFISMIGAYFAMQLQCSLYNYYYVILRNATSGSDVTSKIFEQKVPQAFPGENQQTVYILYHIFNVLYIVFDKTVQFLDPKAYKSKSFSSWFMTCISFYGLGFQLLIMAVMLSIGWVAYIIPFFIGYSILILLFVFIRRIVL
jgi:phosphatidylglycerophosphate synthase